MTRYLTVLVLFSALLIAAPAGATNPCGNNGNNCTQCSDDGGTINATVNDACSARSDSEAEAECSARATSDAFALAVCGNLNFNQQNQICAPFVRNNIRQICTPEVEADARSYCGLYVENEIENELNQRIGDIRNFCGGDVSLSSLLIKFGNVEARCRQSQEQGQFQAAACVDSSENSFDAVQTCEASQQTCSQAVSLQCPNVEAVCAKSVKRYRKHVLRDPLTGKRTKVFDTVTLCKKWAKPVVSFEK